MSTQEERAARFQALHEGEPFVIPNPWDAGSARVLAGARLPGARDDELGLRLHARARSTASVTLDEVAAHVACARRAPTDLPVSVDLENGYGAEADHAARRSRGSRRRAPSAARSRTAIPRAAALRRSITRSSASRRRPTAARGLGFPFTLTARAENHIRGNPDLDDTIARLQAFERAGADVLYAPGLRDGRRDPRSVRGGVQAGERACAPDLTLAEIAEAGGRRVSVGGALTWIAVGAFVEAATAIRDQGELFLTRRQLATSRPGSPDPSASTTP